MISNFYQNVTFAIQNLPKIIVIRLFFFALLIFVSGLLPAQHHLIFPDSTNWNQIKEGQTLSFQVKVKDAVAPKFSLEGTNGYGIQFDTLGNFLWKPSFDLVDRLETQKEINLIFQAEWKDGRKVRTPVNFIVFHQNRPPEIGDLPVFYVKQGTLNRYQISLDYVRDPDGDPLVFKISQAQLPEGMAMSSLGLLTWTPSRSQFNALKNNPLFVEIIVQDPDKAEAVDKIKVAPTQLDLPPEILLVPSDTSITIKENERINLKIYVTDPNGDEDVRNVGFLSSDERVPKDALKENSPVQYEFIWTPGYQFTNDVAKSKSVDIVFYAVDKSSNRIQRKVKVNVVDTENQEEKDKLLHLKYEATLTQAKGLIEELDVNHKKWEKALKQAKKGKVNRSVLSASLGAVTGVTPALTTSANSKTTIAAIGGTSVATLGTLESAQVLGKQGGAIQDHLATNIDIRNQLQALGDTFARKYALKSARRSQEFDKDRDAFLPIINNQKMPSLELDASKPLPTKYTEKELKKTFADYSEE